MGFSVGQWAGTMGCGFINGTINSLYKQRKAIPTALNMQTYRLYLQFVIFSFIHGFLWELQLAGLS